MKAYFMGLELTIEKAAADTHPTYTSQRNQFLHNGDGCRCVSGPRIDCVVRGGNSCSPFANTKV